MSESIFNQFGVGQDEFIFRLYSISLIAISVAATLKGDLRDGLVWMMQPGTYAEQQSNVPLDERVWTVMGKMFVMVLFSAMGFFGSSCSAAITKNFGALTMSITSTARKATTLFLSFLLFDNECTLEHISGIIIFIAALTTKSLRRSKQMLRSDRKNEKRVQRHPSRELDSGAADGMLPLSVSSFDDSANRFAQQRREDAESSLELRRHHRSRSGDGSIHDITTPPKAPRQDTDVTRRSPKVRYHVV
jgi:hypothetical protein